MRKERSYQSAFTLIEMILTLVVGGILVLGIAGFVELGTKGYADSVDRYRLQTQAKFVIEKMSREVRHAVPNLFQNTGDASQSCVRFYPIDYSGFYAISGADINFIVGTSGATSTNIIDAGRFLIINPTNIVDTANSIGLESSIVSISGATYTISGAASSLASTSVANRHYIYSEDVEYCVIPSVSRITRNDVIVADSVESGDFRYVEANMQRGGLVNMELLFSQNGEETSYQQDVQVLNVP